MEDLTKELSESYPQGLELMWRSKPFKTSTWLQRWKRVWWIKHLFGRILKHSTQNHFATEYTASLAVIHARVKASQEKENYGTMTGSFGRILNKLSSQLDLFSVSLKTSQDTSQDLSPTYLQAYDLWVTQLRADSLQRQKLAHRIRENDFSYSQSTKTPTAEKSGNSWPTPQAQIGATNTSQGKRRLQLPKAVKHDWMTPQTVDVGTARPPRLKTGKRNPEQIGNWRADLKDQVKQWPTPRAFCYKDSNHDRGKSNLGEVVSNWPTPQTSETEKAAKNTKQDSLSKRAINGQLDPDNSNTSGNNQERLNPAWVAQLMGTTLEQSFFANMAME